MSAAAARLRAALARHQAGDLAGAMAEYVAILAAHPGDFDALHLLGVAQCQAGQPEAGVGLLEAAHAARPGEAAARANLAAALRSVAARARAADPAGALLALDRAVGLAPDHAASQFNRANLLREAGRAGEAIAGYSAALALAPGDVAAWLNRGSTLLASGDAAAALADFSRAAALAPDDALPAINRAAALRALSRPAEALDAAAAAAARWPGHAAAQALHGVVLADLRRHGAALAAYDRALACDVTADTVGHRAASLRALDRHGEALDGYARAIALAPSVAAHHTGRAGVLADLGRIDDALAGFAEALALAPGDVEAHAFRSLALLGAGDYARGWAEYEWRARMPGAMAGRFGAAGRWRGEALAGREVFLHWEQGFGDTLQFLRFARVLRDRGARVTVSVQAPLAGLARSLGPDIAIAPEGAAPPAGGLHCPLLSVPAMLGTTEVPLGGGYLRADPAAVAARRAMAAGGALVGRALVGLAWSGNPGHVNDRNRSIPLAALGPLLAADAGFVSLLPEVRDSDRAALAASPILRPAGVADFADSAALAAVCDLVITVDTAAAHLAGALGRPVWVLLPTPCDWRWGIEGEATPWYAGARLFRRPAGAAWGATIAAVRRALDLWIAGRVAG